MDDHELAGHLAQLAGETLLRFRNESIQAGMDPWTLRDRGDLISHNLLIEELHKFRPEDSVLSEEGVDDRKRLDADRIWIVDPLDGSQDYPYNDSEEWAVHVALIESGALKAGAVACPSLGRHYTTGMSLSTTKDSREDRVIVSNRWNSYQAAYVAEALGARLACCGSAGIKTALVIGGEADIYMHNSGLYEWDVCAPVAVARAAGLSACQLDGQNFEFNKRNPVVRGLLICRPELLDEVLSVIMN